MKLTLEEGSRLVFRARQAVDAAVCRNALPEDIELKETFSEPRGCFVTLFKGEARQLRGCIGYPQPILPLYEALVRVAIDVTNRDPRFPPVKPDELPHITVEVNVLTPPTLIEVAQPEDYLAKVKIGEDGLFLQAGYTRGLLLPQVASDRGWDANTFLEHTCYKAGLSPSAWRDIDNTKIYKFQSQIFEEQTPYGKIIELGEVS